MCGVWHVGTGLHESVSYCGSMTMLALSWRVQCSHLFLTTSVSLLLSEIARSCSSVSPLIQSISSPLHRQCAIKHAVRLAPHSLLAKLVRRREAPG